MAHFAKIGVGSIVERVEVINNDVATTEAESNFFKNFIKSRPVETNIL